MTMIIVLPCIEAVSRLDEQNISFRNHAYTQKCLAHAPYTRYSFAHIHTSSRHELHNVYTTAPHIFTTHPPTGYLASRGSLNEIKYSG